MYIFLWASGEGLLGAQKITFLFTVEHIVLYYSQWQFLMILKDFIILCIIPTAAWFKALWDQYQYQLDMWNKKKPWVEPLTTQFPENCTVNTLQIGDVWYWQKKKMELQNRYFLWLLQ